MSSQIKSLALLFCFVIMTGCRQHVTESDISGINGYWEIEKVVFANGSEKEYKINETIDFFTIKNDKGFRKKVKPQFNGKYLENGDSEAITVSFDDGTAHIKYKTPFMQWQEEIVEISKEHLVLKNNGNVEYHYKKTVPFSLK